jgi:CubicO group peptidase (beta-lactamase class C family)
MVGRILPALAAAWLLAAPGASAQAASADAPAPADGAAPLALADLVKAAAALPRLHSLIVSQRGTILAEQYFNGARATRPANVKSVSKSVISALVGIAIDRGLVPGVDQPIGVYFPELLRGDADAAKRRITVEDLLTMRSGLASTSGRNYGAWVTSPNWVRYVLSRRLEREPGTSMRYSTGNTHLLSAILARVAKKSTWQFAQESLARPLGFVLARWPADPQGIHFGGNEMLLTPRQMLAFGELYLNRGRVGDREVVPAWWVDQSFVPRGRSNFSDQFYGYGWWIRDLAGEQAYYAWGYGGQYIFVVPARQLVVVTTSSTAEGDERRSHRRTVFDLVEQLIRSDRAADSQPD